ncbi:MAG: HD domain-containing protein [Kiloniellaceae bacterium]
METVTFMRMADGTREDYAFLDRLWTAHKQAHLSPNVLGLLKAMRGPMLGYKVDRYEHSLQTATRALRDGADEETVVCALLHDIGDTIAPDNHSAIAAAVLRPYVSDRNHWIILHHGIFQGYYFWHHLDGDRNARERYRGHEHFQACVDFCERWDQTSFDPDYDTMPLEAFEPMAHRLFARAPRTFV